MDYKTAKDAIDFYAKNSLYEAETPSVTFFGGEPMLKYNEIIKPLVLYIRANYGDYNISITTNGTLLNEEIYEFFKENNVDMLLSLDGMQKIQDYNRPYHSGKGSFDDIDIKMHLKYYPNGTFRATIDPDTVKFLYENYLWGEKEGFKHCSFIINTGGNWTQSKIKTFKSQLDKVAEHIIECKKENKPFMEYTEISKMKKDYELLENIDKNYFREQGQNFPACGVCGLGASKFASIGSSGDIYSCQEMTENPEHDEFIIGNIYSGMNEQKRMELVKSFNTKNVKSAKKGRCETCKLNKVCKGGCIMHNFWENKKIDVMPEILCEAYEYYLEKYREIREVK